MKTWKIADIGLFFKNSIQAILKGEFLLRLNIGRYFVHIAYKTVVDILYRALV